MLTDPADQLLHEALRHLVGERVDVSALVRRINTHLARHESLFIVRGPHMQLFVGSRNRMTAFIPRTDFRCLVACLEQRGSAAWSFPILLDAGVSLEALYRRVRRAAVELGDHDRRFEFLRGCIHRIGDDVVFNPRPGTPDILMSL